jgi:hypothetical protein
MPLEVYVTVGFLSHYVFLFGVERERDEKELVGTLGI